MTNVGYAALTIIPSLKGMQQQLTAGMAGPSGVAGATAGTTAGKKFGGSMLTSVKGFVGPLAALTAGAAVFGFLKGAQSDASDLNETVNKSKTIFGDQFAAIDKWAGSAATNLGLSRAAALDASAGFGDMFTQLGFAGDTAAQMAQDVVGLSADLGSFNNLPTADVAGRIAAAFRGEYDSLQTLIPNINAARVQTEALAMTGKKNAAELTAQEKAAAVLAIVNKDGARAMGDFARTSDANANKQKILSARFADLKAKIGQGLIPVMGFLLDIGGKLIGFFTGGSGAASGFGKVIGTVIGWIKSFITGNMATFQSWWTTLQGIFNGLKTLVETVVGFITAFWESHGAQIMASVKTVWDAIKTVISSALAIIKGIITTVIAIVTGDWAGAWEAIKGIFEAAWEGIKAILTVAVELIKTVLTAAWAFILSALTLAWDAIKAALATAWEGIKALFNAGVEFISGIPGRIVEFLSGIWDFIVTEVTTMKTDAIQKFIEWITWLSGLPGRILSALGDFGSLLLQVGKDLIQGLIDGIGDMLGSLWDMMGGIGSDLVQRVKEALGIASPSRIMAGIGRDIGAGLVQGLESQRRQVQGVAADLARAAVAGGSSLRLTAGAGRAGTRGSDGARPGGYNGPPMQVHNHWPPTTPVSQATDSAHRLAGLVGIL